jgi:ABC-type nickel/cobalt efflux system permease component RcnA
VVRSVHIGALAALLFVLLGGSAVSAHPLGNFTINHLVEIDTQPNGIRVRYVLDQAEIPTFSLLRTLDGDARPAASRLDAWLRTESADVAAALVLRMDGTRVPLRLARSAVRLRPGAGNLPTLYATLDYTANVKAAGHKVAFADQTFPGRLGWKDVVVAPATEPTRELQSYPNALIGSPRNTTQAAFTVSPSGAIAASAVPVETAAAAQSFARNNPLSDLLARGGAGPAFLALLFAMALALGALHALEPGHGKALLAVTLVGARATIPQAIALAGSLTFAHTIGVIALGVVVLFAARSIAPEAIYPWITLVSGAAIAFLGARALRRFLLERHEHAHHGHAHPHEHRHIPFRGAILAAMSGGVAPCPAALVVLLTAITVHRIALGLLLIVAFSFGLAALLTGLGIAVVRGAGWITSQRRFERVAAFAPLFTAGVIALIGSLMLGQGLQAQGIDVSPLVTAALVLCAIAAYAVTSLSHGHSHNHVPDSPATLKL